MTFGMVSFRHSVLAGYRSRTSWLARALDGLLLERGIIEGALFTIVGLVPISVVWRVFAKWCLGQLS